MTAPDQLRAAKARACPNCARRVKANPATWDSNGGDYWWCTAVPIIPAFAGAHVYGDMGKGPGRPAGAFGMPINLKLFEEPHTTRMSGWPHGQECPTFASLTNTESSRG